MRGLGIFARYIAQLLMPALAIAGCNGRLAPAEMEALLQIFNATGGHTTWRNTTGWSAAATDASTAPDPCDGSSWHGIWDWQYCGWCPRCLNMSACTPPDEHGCRHLQVLTFHSPDDPGSCSNVPSAADNPTPTPLHPPTPAPPTPAPTPFVPPPGFDQVCPTVTSWQPTCNGVSGSFGGVDMHKLSHLRVFASLMNSRLAGDLEWITQLTALQAIYFIGNDPVGSIPDLARLTSLQELAIHQNLRVNGTMPSLESLTALRFVEFTGTPMLAGTLPNFSRLTALWDFEVSQCNLTGTIPPSIGALTAAYNLALAGNRFEGTIPASIGEMTALQNFNAGGNKLEGKIPTSLSRLSVLKSFTVNSNRLNGSIPAVLFMLTTLAQLNLNGNGIEGTLPAALNSLTAMTQLDLANNSMRGTIPSVDMLTSLTVLALHTNKFDGTIPALHRLTALTNILLQSNNLVGAVPALPLALLNDTTQTHALMLSDNRLSCSLPAAPPDANSSKLIAVVTFGNRFSAPAPDWIPASSRAAAFMFVPKWAPWAWLLAYSAGGVLALGAVVWWAKVRPELGLHPAVPKIATLAVPSNDAARVKETMAFIELMRHSARTIGALSGFGLVLLLPIYVVYGTYFKCGEPLMHTSLAYVVDDGYAHTIVPVLTCAFMIVSALCCAWLQKRMRSHDVWGCQMLKLGASPRAIVLYSCLWFFCTLFLSLPTVMYILAHNLPTNNTIGVGENIGLFLRHGVPFLLVVINSALLPTMTRWVVWNGYQATGHSAGILITQMLLVGRLLTTIIMPVAAMLLMGQDCGQRWKSLWLPCRSNSTEFNVPRPPTETAGDPLNPPPKDLFSTADLCTEIPAYGSSRCVRATIEALAPLFVEKMAIAACLQPAMLIMYFESGLAKFVAERLRGHKGGYRARLDFEFAMVMTWVEMALVYGIVLPIALPIAAMALLSNQLVFHWLVQHRGMNTVPVVLPPLMYVQVGLVMQAVVVTWFFYATTDSDCSLIVAIVAWTIAGVSCANAFRLSRRRLSNESIGHSYAYALLTPHVT